MKRYATHFAIFLCLVGFSDLVGAAPNPTSYDKDKSSFLDREEYTAFFIDFATEGCADHAIGLFDTRQDLIIDPKKLATYKACTVERASWELRDFMDSNGFADTDTGPDKIAVVILKEHYSTPKPEELLAYKPETEVGSKTKFGGLLIRREPEDIFIWTAPKSFQKAESASIAYTHDLETENNIYSIKGALIYPIRKIYEVRPNARGSSDTVLGAFSIVPSIALDWTDDSKGIQRPVDSLGFRLGAEFEFVGGLFDAQFFRFIGHYNTDTDFLSEIGTLTAEWSPVRVDWGLGAANEYNFNGIVGYQLRATAHLEGGDVFAAGNKAQLAQNEFLRFGPNLRLDVWLPDGALERLTAHVSWQYYAALTAKSQSTQIFAAGLDFRLDEAGQFKLGVKYRNGRVATTRDRTQDIKATFDIKF